MLKHRHHIIPVHAGGTDDPSNIAELSIDAHAEAHRKLFEEYGRWQDRCAWLALSGRIGKEEINIMKGQLGYQDWLNNGGRAILSQRVKLQAKSGNFHCIGDYQRGRTFDAGHVDKLKTRANAREKKMCEHCNGVFSPAMFKRWHGDKCRGYYDQQRQQKPNG